MKQRLFSFLIACTLMLTLLPMPATAAAADKKLVAITFDDGPSAYTASLLDGLKARGAYATFFMTGTNGPYSGIAHQTDVLARMWQEGHQLANHTYYHNIKLAKLSSDAIRQEVTSVEEQLFRVTGQRYLDMVRTPGGATGGSIKTAIPAPIILWSVDTLDWKSRNEDTVYNNIVSKVSDGGIILLHDLYPTSINGALRAIDTLQKQGYEFVTVAELMRRRGVTPVNGTVYTKVPKNGSDLPAYTAPRLSVSYNMEMGVQVDISSADSGLTLYYTTDGTMPTLASRKYTGPVSLTQTTTLSVCGIDAYGTRTPLTRQTISANCAAAPQAVYENGLLTLTSTTFGARIYYTTDGSLPTASNGTLYTAPFKPGRCTRAVAVKNALYNSPVITASKTAYGDVFLDVSPNDWFYESVGKIVHQGLMTGTAPCYFDPTGALTRAGAVTILYRLAGSPSVKPTDQAVDVSPDAWFASAVSWAIQNGIASVDGKGNFRPTEFVDRQTFALLLYRYAKLQGAVSGTVPEPDNFSDWSSVANTATQAFAWCVREGILTGTSATTLSPLSRLTRAQCAVILLRLEHVIGSRS